ncbi:Cobyric acid synthase [Serratia fonticola]|uniref:Cobyric acid synthase n=1 Tax=Serratia fonticola TaxID=47917 RepID=A0A4U9T674_SERFO|nr:Cobyric acid synthase [Serratia fonticola]
MEQIEALTGVPVLGVMPWLNIDLEDEDGVALQNGKYAPTGSSHELDIAVVQLPYMSNFTDFNALAAQPDVGLRYVSHPAALAGADLIILPGSKKHPGGFAVATAQRVGGGVTGSAPGRSADRGYLRRLPDAWQAHY